MIMKIFSVNPVTGPSLAFAPSFTLSADHSFLFFFNYLCLEKLLTHVMVC